MKVGILTFHWATNYGAVLQTFALQNVLKGMGHDVIIINYKPVRQDNGILSFIRKRHFLRPLNYIYSLRKEKNIERFRMENLNLSSRYRSKHEVDLNLNQLDVVICGSDQIWNPSFLRSGEGKITTTYFLDFSTEIKKISYAASFGCTTYPTKFKHVISTLLGKFSCISVREQTGKNIIDEMGYSSWVVPDPTLLLTANDYNDTIKCDKRVSAAPFAFIYMLRGEKCTNHTKYLKSMLQIIESKHEDVEQWVSNIKNAKYVITNSFHCMVFCLLYHIPFSIVLKQIDLIGMNDRFYTILSMCQLTERITTDKGDAALAINSLIDWSVVDNVLADYRNSGLHFLIKSLE